MTATRSLEAELLRGVLSTTAHDLGGLASALSLRADVIELDAASEAGSALRRIATELRTLGHDVRAFRSSEGGDTLSPTRSGSLVEWLAGVMRYGRPVLPRGSTLDGVAPDATIEASAAHELTYIALAVLHHIASVCTEPRMAVRVDVQNENLQAVITVSVTVSNAHIPLASEHSGDWWQWALERAIACDIPMHMHHGRVQLTVPLR